MKISTITVVSLAGIVVVGLISFAQVAIWDGGFASAEYQFEFVDGTGESMTDIELRVEDENGNQCLHYPVTDYSPHQVPKVTAEGLLTFHHVSYSGIEFGGRCCNLFGIGDCEAPVFICRFMRDGMEVYRCRFNDLSWAARHAEDSVSRTWTWNDYCPLRRDDVAGAHWIENERAAYDKDGDGKLNIAEGAAWSAAISAFDRSGYIKRGIRPESERLVFPVVRRTIEIN